MSLTDQMPTSRSAGPRATVPTSTVALAILTAGGFGFMLLAGCFCIGLMMLHVPADFTMGKVSAIEWTRGQRMLEVALWVMGGVCMTASLALLMAAIRRGRYA